MNPVKTTSTLLILGGAGIGKNLVNLPDLQIFSPFVPNTDRKLFFLMLHVR